MSRVSRENQAGVGLIEVMIAVLILAVGVIGIGATHLAALRRSQLTFERSQAVVLSSMIADSMRANRAAAIAGDYDTRGEICKVPSAATRSTSQEDLATWIAAIKRETVDLDDSCGKVTCIESVCEISIVWNVSRIGGVDQPADARERHDVAVAL